MCACEFIAYHKYFFFFEWKTNNNEPSWKIRIYSFIGAHCCGKNGQAIYYVMCEFNMWFSVWIFFCLFVCQIKTQKLHGAFSRLFLLYGEEIIKTMADKRKTCTQKDSFPSNLSWQKWFLLKKFSIQPLINVECAVNQSLIDDWAPILVAESANLVLIWFGSNRPFRSWIHTVKLLIQSAQHWP